MLSVFTRSIEPLLESFHTKALILGTGGASKAIQLRPQDTWHRNTFLFHEVHTMSIPLRIRN